MGEPPSLESAPGLQASSVPTASFGGQGDDIRFSSVPMFPAEGSWQSNIGEAEVGQLQSGAPLRKSLLQDSTVADSLVQPSTEPAPATQSREGPHQTTEMSSFAQLQQSTGPTMQIQEGTGQPSTASLQEIDQPMRSTLVESTPPEEFPSALEPPTREADTFPDVPESAQSLPDSVPPPPETSALLEASQAPLTQSLRQHQPYLLHSSNSQVHLPDRMQSSRPILLEESHVQHSSVPDAGQPATFGMTSMGQSQRSGMQPQLASFTLPNTTQPQSVAPSAPNPQQPPPPVDNVQPMRSGLSESMQPPRSAPLDRAQPQRPSLSESAHPAPAFPQDLSQQKRSSFSRSAQKPSEQVSEEGGGAGGNPAPVRSYLSSNFHPQRSSAQNYSVTQRSTADFFQTQQPTLAESSYAQRISLSGQAVRPSSAAQPAISQPVFLNESSQPRSAGQQAAQPEIFQSQRVSNPDYAQRLPGYLNESVQPQRPSFPGLASRPAVQLGESAQPQRASGAEQGQWQRSSANEYGQPQQSSTAESNPRPSAASKLRPLLSLPLHMTQSGEAAPPSTGRNRLSFPESQQPGVSPRGAPPLAEGRFRQTGAPNAEFPAQQGQRPPNKEGSTRGPLPSWRESGATGPAFSNQYPSAYPGYPTSGQTPGYEGNERSSFTHIPSKQPFYAHHPAEGLGGYMHVYAPLVVLPVVSVPVEGSEPRSRTLRQLRKSVDQVRRLLDRLEDEQPPRARRSVDVDREWSLAATHQLLRGLGVAPQGRPDSFHPAHDHWAWRQ